MDKEVILIGSLILLTIIFVIGLIITLIVGNDSIDEEWNNGICSECGGEYRFSCQSKACGFYYTCQDCGHTIKTYNIKK